MLSFLVGQSHLRSNEHILTSQRIHCEQVVKSRLFTMFGCERIFLRREFHVPKSWVDWIRSRPLAAASKSPLLGVTFFFIGCQSHRLLTLLILFIVCIIILVSFFFFRAFWVVINDSIEHALMLEVQLAAQNLQIVAASWWLEQLLSMCAIQAFAGFNLILICGAHVMFRPFFRLWEAPLTSLVCLDMENAQNVAIWFDH